jgi:hypothetical protein
MIDIIFRERILERVVFFQLFKKIILSSTVNNFEQNTQNYKNLQLKRKVYDTC